MKWDLDSAIKFIRELEPLLAANGAHCGLTGSVLYSGLSLKDLDIIIYPHDKQENGWDYLPILRILSDKYGVLYKYGNPYPVSEDMKKWDLDLQIITGRTVELTEYRDSKDVFGMTLADGNRVDLFFLS